METREQELAAAKENYVSHVENCRRCKISGPRGQENIRHCERGEVLQTKAVLLAIRDRKPRRTTDH